MSGIPTLTLLSEEQKFSGNNLQKWSTNMRQLLGSKGLLGYIDGKVTIPSQPAPGDPTPDATPVYSTTPNYDEWSFRDQLARGHITLNCTDVDELGVKTTGTAREAWDSIQDEWGKSTEMRRSHAQEALDRTVYAEDSDIQEHIKLLRTRKAAVDNLSTTPMTEEMWKGIVIRSIPPTSRWLPVIPSLYAMSTTADIFSTLLAHGMILDRGTRNKPTSGTSNTALVARSADACTNPNCKAKKRSTHTTANCYWPGGGKEGQFPPGFGQRSKANVARSNSNNVEHFVLSACVSCTTEGSDVIIHDDPFEERSPLALVSNGFHNFSGGRIPTFLDSGASDTMFISRDDFNVYKTVPPRSGDSAKAVDGAFEIVGEGTVIKHYLVDGQTKKLTYTRAIHTPTLNANLISVSAFDRAGLAVTFEGGRGVIRKKDGTAVLSARCVRGMYVVDETNGDIPGTGIPDTALAMISLSQPTTLEQWHRRLAHCSPLTIGEMLKGNLVDGLNVSDSDLRGKCEDCVVGRQTRRPFDGKTETDLEPLELVSFDLWGPSRVQSAGGKIYFMPVVDGGSSFKYGAYLSDKSDASTIAAFDMFRVEAESLSGRKIRRLRTDRAYDSSAWRDYCQGHGILHEFTAPYSSAQNGLAERAIRTTIDDVRTLLRDSGLSHSYWAEAASYSVFTRNLIPSRRHPGRIPLETFTGRRQTVSHLRVFGAKCWAKIPTVNGAQVTGGSKLDPRGVECRFLGYAGGNGNYKVQDLISRRVVVSRDVIFEEGQPRRTSPNVGGNLPLFDVATTDEGTKTFDDSETTEQQTTDQQTPDQQVTNQPNVVTDPVLDDQRDHRVDIPTEPIQLPEPRHSSRISQPSTAILQSKEYKQREETGRDKGEEWTTNRRFPQAGLSFDRLLDEQDEYIACLVETKASHSIPRSYRHAMSTDPDLDIEIMSFYLSVLSCTRYMPAPFFLLPFFSTLNQYTHLFTL